MLFIIMLQTGAVVEIITQRGFHVEAELPEDGVFRSGCGMGGPLPRFVVETFLHRHAA